MPKYFELDRIKQAVQHLGQFRSEWIIVPLVFAVNGISTVADTNPNEKDKPGTDRFLDRHFNGSLIGLPAVGNGSLRPKFSDVVTEAGDLAAHQAVKLWGSHYSSRGYREMAQKGLLTTDGKRYRLNAAFWPAWEAALPNTFHFEELLVWLYAFSGFGDLVNSWDGLFIDLQEKYLGTGGRFLTDYTRRFHVGNSVPWPTSLLNSRPSDRDLQKLLFPSRFGRPRPASASAPIKPETDVETLVGEFDAALTAANLSFGSAHAATVRNFVVSVLAKPFVILTGLSGSGKTQIAKKFGEWLGEDRYLLVPVRPDWSTADALFGYENLLDTGTKRQWIVPDVLQLILRAASDTEHPYLLILDEMNLGHVERYFGDFLSGIESGNDVIPNLADDGKGAWRLKAGKKKLPIPSNLIVIGTVNVDETTYMFSPKVLDRANTLEFRVQTDDLSSSYVRLKACAGGKESSLLGVVHIMNDREFPEKHANANVESVSTCLRTIHQILSATGFEFGNRTFNEAIRFSTLFEAARGEWRDALDAQVFQKVLPRLHGSQRAVGSTLRSLSHYCKNLPATAADSLAQASTFNFDDNSAPQLPLSYRKLKRMFERLKLHQFTAFAE